MDSGLYFVYLLFLYFFSLDRCWPVFSASHVHEPCEDGPSKYDDESSLINQMAGSFRRGNLWQTFVWFSSWKVSFCKKTSFTMQSFFSSSNMGFSSIDALDWVHPRMPVTTGIVSFTFHRWGLDPKPGKQPIEIRKITFFCPPWFLGFNVWMFLHVFSRTSCN